MLTYQKKLLISFAALFALFAIVLVVFQWQRERDFRQELLEAHLRSYADIISRQDTIRPPHTVDSVRTTVIQANGNVLYESMPHFSVSEMGNHINRPEVRAALNKGEGHDIRRSSTTGEEFFYYAKRYNNVKAIRTGERNKKENKNAVTINADNEKGNKAKISEKDDDVPRVVIVREALPFNLSVRHFIRSSNNMFIWFFLLAFALTFSVLIFLSDRFGRTVSDVKRKERARTQNVKRQMTNNITHELRTPVAAIHGYIETLIQNPNLPEQTKLHFLNRALMQSERLTDLIRDVSIISKTEEAPDLLPREDLCINDIVNDVAEELHQDLQEADIRLTVSLPDNVHLSGNYSLVYSIVRNLIENTIRYAGKGAQATFMLDRQTPTHLYFVYWDNGPGVADEHLPRIFERFYRADEGRTHTDKGGTGLGLSIVKNAVLFHGGEISAENRPEGGLLFRFSLRK